MNRIYIGMLVFLSILLVVLPLGAGAGVSIGVDQALRGQLLVTEQEVEPGQPATWTVEAHNQGSNPFAGWIRLDVLDEENMTVFRAWSDVIQVEPGAFTAHTLAFAAPDMSGNLTAHLVLHHGTERVARTVPFTTKEWVVKPGFRVPRLRTYDDVIRATVVAPNDVDAFVVTLDDRSTRRFAQQHVENSGGRQVVEIDYVPKVLDEEDARLTISSLDGKYHYTEDVVLYRETGMVAAAMRWLSELFENGVFI